MYPVIKRVQGIVGDLLYYVWAIDNNLLTALRPIGDQKASPTKRTYASIVQLPEYVTTYPNDDIAYCD